VRFVAGICHLCRSDFCHITYIYTDLPISNIRCYTDRDINLVGAS
jgi:hypothetical protein